VGRLIKQKGIDLLVEAFVEIVGQIPGARLEIIGYGPEKETIQTIVRTNHLEKAVTMIETVPHDELAQVYRRSRVLMLPALIPEGLGMTAAEAGLCGVPTITFGLGGTKEIVLDGRTGLIVEPDREALRDALMRIMTDGDLADELGRNARLFLSDAVAWPKIASRFDSLFREILQAHGNPANRRGIIPTLIIALVTFGYMVKAVIDRPERILSIFK
jgi:phosphatidylinositol alpha-1,6-mannosyltransferase